MPWTGIRTALLLKDMPHRQNHCWRATTPLEQEIRLNIDERLCPFKLSPLAGAPRSEREPEVLTTPMESPVDSTYFQSCHDTQDWAERLCSTTFFDQCLAHCNHRHRRCECTFFCLDCKDTGALCGTCFRNHANCRTLQIRRYVYRDVVKVEDIKRFLDPFGVQTYTVNHAQAIFLTAKDKALVGPYYRVDSTSACVTCSRGLREGCRYCSLQCKLVASKGFTFEAKEPLRRDSSTSSSVQRARSTSPMSLQKARMQRSDSTSSEDAATVAHEALRVHQSGSPAPLEANRLALFMPSMPSAHSRANGQALVNCGTRKRVRGDSTAGGGNTITGLSLKSRRKQHRPSRASE